MYDANADGNIDPYEFIAIVQDLNISLFETPGNDVSYHFLGINFSFF